MKLYIKSKIKNILIFTLILNFVYLSISAEITEIENIKLNGQNIRTSSKSLSKKVKKLKTIKRNNKLKKRKREFEFEDLDYESKVSLFMAYLHQTSLQITPRCQDKISFKIGNGKACFGYFINNLCRRLESFVYHGVDSPGLIFANELPKAKAMLEILKINYDLYKQIVEKFIGGKFQGDQCLVGITLNPANPLSEVASSETNPQKRFSIIVLCNKDNQTSIKDLKANFNSLYLENLLDSTNYFSIFSLPNHTPFKLNYFSERLMESFEDSNILLKEDGILISDKHDVECKESKYSNGYTQFMQCLPISVTNKYNKYFNKKDEKQINTSCCIEMTLDWKTYLLRNSYCFEKSEFYSCDVYTKLFEAALARNCLLNQVKYFRQILLQNENKLKCLYPSDDSKEDKLNMMDSIKFKNLVRFSKLLYKNVREWRADLKDKSEPLYIGENYKRLISKLEVKTQKMNINTFLLIFKKNTRDPIDNVLKTQLDWFLEEENYNLSSDIEGGITGSVDALVSINEDWAKRSSKDLNDVPVDEESKCGGSIKPKADPAKDYDDMAARLQKKIDIENKNKADEEARLKAIEDAKKKAEAEKIAKEEEEKRKAEEAKKKAEAEAQAKIGIFYYIYYFYYFRGREKEESRGRS